MIVIDNFLDDAEWVRRMALSSEFEDWRGPDGETYRRICRVEIPGVRERIEALFGPVDVLGMGFRLNFGGELPNAAVHSDIGWGTHALVLYLTPDGEGGTAFWRHIDTGAHRIDPGQSALLDAVSPDWNDPGAWEPLHIVDWEFNRGVIYESALFHSRYPFAAFGDGPEDGRLIGVCFFTPKESE